MKGEANQPVYGGNYGGITMAIFNNKNVKNRLYRIIRFSKRYVLNGVWKNQSIAITAGNLANLQQALNDAKKWLRDK